MSDILGAGEPPTDVAEARRLLVGRLRDAGLPSPEADALQLLEAALGVERATLLLRPDRPLEAEERERLAGLLERRLAREPLQLIVGHAPFYGLELAVAPGVLIPRPETERLVELVLEELKGRTAYGARPADAPPLLLDVGCGTGAIALALKAELPAAEVWATDLASEALALTRRNAAELGLEVTVRASDLLADPEVARAAARCAALVSNPPYLPEADRGRLAPEAAADPDAALFGGADGLAVARRLVAQAERLLPHGALLALELDPRNAPALAGELTAWRDVRVAADLVGRERFVLARR